MKEMHAARMQNEVDIISLPWGVLSNIGSWLDDREECNMELASKAFYDALSRPSGTPRRTLVLKPISEEDSPAEAPPRWYTKRILRYSHIIYEDLCGIGNVSVWPLLPSLLAACAPSAELKLSISPGERLLAMSTSITSRDPGLQLSFWADLQQHLTYLRLWLRPGNAKAQLETIGTLTSLRELIIYHKTHPHLYADLSGEKLALKLPNLVISHISSLENGELLLSCPKLAEAWLYCTHELHVKVEHAVLQKVELINCKQIQFAMRSPETQFHNLKSLYVSTSSESGKHIIQDISHMQSLQTLTYDGFPAACMPTRFPRSLQSLSLYPNDWCSDLPRGLKELTNLKTLAFLSDHRAWDCTLPWEEYLPIESLETVTLRSSEYVRQDDGGKATFVRVDEPEPEYDSEYSDYEYYSEYSG